VHYRAEHPRSGQMGYALFIPESFSRWDADGVAGWQQAGEECAESEERGGYEETTRGKGEGGSPRAGWERHLSRVLLETLGLIDSPLRRMQIRDSLHWSGRRQCLRLASPELHDNGCYRRRNRKPVHPVRQTLHSRKRLLARLRLTTAFDSLKQFPWRHTLFLCLD